MAFFALVQSILLASFAAILAAHRSEILDKPGTAVMNMMDELHGIPPKPQLDQCLICQRVIAVVILKKVGSWVRACVYTKKIIKRNEWSLDILKYRSITVSIFVSLCMLILKILHFVRFVQSLCSLFIRQRLFQSIRMNHHHRPPVLSTTRQRCAGWYLNEWTFCIQATMNARDVSKYRWRVRR